MYVALEDSAGNVGVLSNPDGNAATVVAWTQWYSSLYDINSAGSPSVVQLKAISAFYLGFGERCLENGEQDQGGEGNVMFDNIRLYASTCNPSYNQTADMNGDCFVDLYDLMSLSNYWLTQATVINYTDKVAPSKAPILWYKFNESGTTNLVVDYGTGDSNNYQGTVENWTALNWNATGGRNGDACLYIVPQGPFPTSTESYVDAPPAAMGFLGDAAHNDGAGGTYGSGGGCTVTLWANASMVGDFLAQWPGIWGFWNTANTAEDTEVPCPSRLNGTGSVGTTGQVGYYLHVSTSDGRTAQVGNNTFLPLIDFGGRWNHWAFVKSNESNDTSGNPQTGLGYGSIKIYCNGTLVCETDANGAAGDPNAQVYGPPTYSPGAIHIGTRGSNWAMWSGKMQDFQIYDYALSTQEIEYLATDGTGYRVLPITLRQNLYVDPGGDAAQIINFEDLSVMGDQWHTLKLWP